MTTVLSLSGPHVAPATESGSPHSSTGTGLPAGGTSSGAGTDAFASVLEAMIFGGPPLLGPQPQTPLPKAGISQLSSRSQLRSQPSTLRAGILAKTAPLSQTGTAFAASNMTKAGNRVFVAAAPGSRQQRSGGQDMPAVKAGRTVSENTTAHGLSGFADALPFGTTSVRDHSQSRGQVPVIGTFSAENASQSAQAKLSTSPHVLTTANTPTHVSLVSGLMQKSSRHVETSPVTQPSPSLALSPANLATAVISNAATAAGASTPVASTNVVTFGDLQSLYGITQAAAHVSTTGQHVLQVQVHPAGLGSILVSVVQTPTGVNVGLQANQMQVMQWLGAHAETLQSQLQDSGLAVNQVAVSFGDTSLHGNGQGSSERRQRSAEAVQKMGSLKRAGGFAAVKETGPPVLSERGLGWQGSTYGGWI